MDRLKAAHELSTAVREGDQDWLQDWLDSSIWDGKSLVDFVDAVDTAVYPASLLHKVLEECPSEFLPSCLSLLLRHGVDPNLRSTDDSRDTPIHVAARRSQVADICLPMLVRAGADLRQRNAAGNSVWHEWVSHTSSNQTSSEGMHDLTRLFARVLPIQHCNAANWTPLHFCSRHAVLAEHLVLAHHAPLHAATITGQTPLHLAARFGSVLTVRVLLQNGAFCYASDAEGRTPLHEAAIGGFLNLAEIVQLAQQKYGVVNWDVKCRSGTTVVHNAVVHPSALTVLSHHRAPLASTDRQGWTALHYAAWIGNLVTVRALVAADASLLYMVDKRGRNVLHAAAGGLPYPVTTWLENGRNLANLRDAWWQAFEDLDDTPAEERSERASLSLPTCQPVTTTSVVHKDSIRNVVVYLLSQGVQVGVMDTQGNYPWAYSEDVATIHILVQAGMQEGLLG